LLENKGILKERISAEMEKQSLKYLDLVGLAINYPDLYWNAAFFFKKNIGLIDDFLKESGLCDRKARRR
jgi:hypothetical protein